MFGFVIILIFAIIGILIGKNGITKNENDDLEIKFPVVIVGIIFIIAGFVIAPSLGIIKSGECGVVLRLGAMTGKTLNQGLYFVAPMIDEVEKMSVQVNAYPAEATAASRDMQEVSTKVTLNYQLKAEKVGEIYRDMRKDYPERVIAPSIQEAVKAATALFNAEELINQREKVRSKIKELLVIKLETQYGIGIRDVSITDFNFSKNFNEAIERKATAVQDAETAKRNLEKVKMEQAAQIEVAKAQAESLRLQKQNVTPELIRLRQIDAQLEMIKKWDGKFPTVMAGGNTPLMLNLGEPK
jgi:regulator of protease activity HflC (stomatin/prohibitin superfamily)